MYMATDESTYKSDINKDDVKTHYHVLDYSNSHDLAAYAVANAVSEYRETSLDLALNEFVNKYTNSGNINDEKVTTLGGGWGQMRYAGNTAFSVALYSLAKDITQYDQFIYDQVDYILGSNKAKQSFMVGFCAGCSKVASKPHHRNVYLRDDNPGDDERQNSMTIPERNKYFGYLVGGNRVSSSYVDNVNDYQNTEGGIDYSAGLLGALAYIVSKVDPAPDIPQEPDPITPLANKTLLGNFSVRFVGAHEFPAQSKSFSVQIFDLKGNKIATMQSEGQALRYTPNSKNVYFAVVK